MLTDFFVPDDRYEWHEIWRLCDVEPRLIRGRCLHRDVVPVESHVTGEVVAQLCLVCDKQLPADRPKDLA